MQACVQVLQSPGKVGQAGASEHGAGHCPLPILGAAASNMIAASIGSNRLALHASEIMWLKPEASRSEEIRELYRAAEVPVF
jgi:hypothetical protein